MKIAVCISGSLRGNLGILKYTNDTFVKKLGADLFIDVWDKYYYWPGKCGGVSVLSRFVGPNGRYLPKELFDNNVFKKNFPKTYTDLITEDVRDVPVAFLEGLNPKRLSIHNESVFEQNVNDYKRPNGSTFNHLKMFYLISMGIKSCIEYSRAFNFEYDLIIRIRPDILHNSFPTFNSATDIKNNTLYTTLYEFGLGDIVFYGSSVVMEKISLIWDVISKSKNLCPFKYVDVASHSLLFLWCLKQGVYLQDCDIKFRFDLVFNGQKDYRKLFGSEFGGNCSFKESDFKLFFESIEKSFNFK